MNNNQFINILAAFPGSGLYVHGQLYELATPLDVQRNRISFEDTTGMVHHFLNCAVQTETVTSDASESFTSPIIDKCLNCLVVSLRDLNGLITAEYKNVRDLDFNAPGCDIAFKTEEGKEITFSGGPIIVDEVWVDTLPDKYIQEATNEALPAMLDELVKLVMSTITEKFEGQLDEQITAMLPTAFVQHLLDNGIGFTNAHDSLRAMLLPALSERLCGGDNNGDGDNGGGDNGGDNNDSTNYLKYPTLAPLPNVPTTN